MKKKSASQIFLLFTRRHMVVLAPCQVPWSEVVSNIANMTEKMDNFANRCKKLPGRLKQWDAFTQLRLESTLAS